MIFTAELEQAEAKTRAVTKDDGVHEHFFEFTPIEGIGVERNPAGQIVIRLCESKLNPDVRREIWLSPVAAEHLGRLLTDPALLAKPGGGPGELKS